MTAEKGEPNVRADRSEGKTVVVLEEWTAIRELLGNFVASLEGFRVVGLAGDRDETERLCELHRPDIAVIDWAPVDDPMRGSLADAIRKRSPRTKVVMFSGTADPHFVGEAIAAGAAGFVVKNATLETLAKALRSVVAGKQFFCPEMAGVLRELLQHSSVASAERSALLTPREREVLREIARGHFSKEIAQTLHLTVFAVENIRRRIMRKTGLNSIAELTLHAAKLRLVGIPAALPSEEPAKKRR